METSNKRRKLPARDGPSVIINVLSDDTLALISSYLPKTSVLLFAAAMTAPSSAWSKKRKPSKSSKAIVSSIKSMHPPASLLESLVIVDVGDPPVEDKSSRESRRIYLRRKREWKSKSRQRDQEKTCFEEQLIPYYEDNGWGTLDFIDIGHTLASKLNDADLGAMLACIDAKSNLKRLKLTHCLGIVGDGLDVLRGSTVLESIDASLVAQFERPKLFKGAATLSDKVVLGVLNDILTEEENVFRLLRVPLSWCKEYLVAIGCNLLEYMDGNEVGGDYQDDSDTTSDDDSDESKKLTALDKFLDKQEYECLMVPISLCCYFNLTCTPEEFCKSLKTREDSSPIEQCFKKCRYYTRSTNENFSFCTECSKVYCNGCCDAYQCDYFGCNKWACGDCTSFFLKSLIIDERFNEEKYDCVCTRDKSDIKYSCPEHREESLAEFIKDWEKDIWSCVDCLCEKVKAQEKTIDTMNQENEQLKKVIEELRGLKSK